MFCSHCGSEVKSCFKFCVECGNPTAQNSDDRSSSCETMERHSSRTGCLEADLSTSDVLSSKEPVPKLETFMKKKKDERVSHFKRKNKKLKNKKGRTSDNKHRNTALRGGGKYAKASARKKSSHKAS